jgi:predicted acylesterase/phospholipase RssA
MPPVTAVRRPDSPMRAAVIREVDGVFEGGGSLGVAYAGAVQAMASRGVWFKRVVGNSAGSVTAAMIAAGFNAEEIEFLSAPEGARARPASLPAGIDRIGGASLQDLPASANDFSLDSRRRNLLWRAVNGTVIDQLLALTVTVQPPPAPGFPAPPSFTVSLGSLASFTLPSVRSNFADAVVESFLNSHSAIRAIFGILAEGGMYLGDVALEGLRNTLNLKLNRNPVRFRDLPMPLAVCATNMSRQRLEVYSSTATPDMEVAEAVRRSISVPFYFRPRDQAGDDVVDGGLLENFPVSLVLMADNGLFSNTPEDLNRPKILFQVDGSQNRPAGSPCPEFAAPSGQERVARLFDTLGTDLVERRFLERLSNCMDTALNASAVGETIARSNAMGSRVGHVVIPLKAYDWLEFDQSEEIWKGMCCRGWEATMAVLRAKRIGRAAFRIGGAGSNPYHP